jgi:drug/metabolite transporter (DMT)-like permease
LSILLSKVRKYEVWGRIYVLDFSKILLSNVLNIINKKHPMDIKNKSVFFMLGATALYSVNEAFAKLIVTDYPLGNFMCLRSLMTLLLLLLFARNKNLKSELVSNFKLNFFRSFLAATGTFLMFWALKFMPLTDCRLLLFTSPLFAYLLAKPVLGEHFALNTLLAVVLGFLGASFVAFPSEGVMDPISLVVLLAAFLLGLSNVISRKLTFKSSPYAITLNYTLLCLVLGVALFSFNAPLPTAEQFGLIALMSVVNLAAQYGIINAFKYGEVSKIAPLEYIELIYAMILGFLIWGDKPTVKLALGSGLVIISGILSLYKWKAGKIISASEK